MCTLQLSTIYDADLIIAIGEALKLRPPTRHPAEPRTLCDVRPLAECCQPASDLPLSSECTTSVPVPADPPATVRRGRKPKESSTPQTPQGTPAETPADQGGESSAAVGDSTSAAAPTEGSPAAGGGPDFDHLRARCRKEIIRALADDKANGGKVKQTTIVSCLRKIDPASEGKISALKDEHLMAALAQLTEIAG